jgi:hypothetical protein
MRVVCIHLPRRAQSDAGAVYETTWGLKNARFFLHQLDDLVESIWEPFSLELYSSSNIIYICFAASDSMIDYLTTGMYTWMSDCEVHEVEDYTLNVDRDTVAVGAEVRLARSEVYPIQNYEPFAYDSLSPIIASMSHLPEGDRLLLQVVVRPIKDKPTLHLELAVKRTLARIAQNASIAHWFKKDLKNNTTSLVQTKCLAHLFRINYRLVALSQLPPKAGAKLQGETVARLSSHIHNVSSAVKVLDTLDENRLSVGRIETGQGIITKAQERRFVKPYLVSGLELTTLWHPPNLATLPNTAQVVSRKAPPPRHLPSQQDDDQICFFGHTNYRDQAVPFGIKRFDRARHLYVVGKSGSGKSCLLQLLLRNDIENGFGCAVLDPHGDLVDDILQLIPRHRVNDVVLFDPADTNFPPSFNPMNPVRPELKTRVTLSFLDTFRRVFGTDWSEKMDHVLRYAIMGLLNIPGSSIMSLRRMLSDDAFRTEVVRRTSDEAVKRFWLRDFVAHRKDFEEGPISQLLNRLDEVLATDMIRNIVGQPLNLFDFREFMDTRKIVLLKISKGVLGAENAEFLGSLLIWKIYEAAMSRADVPVEQRQDFYFYIDEFQNFATESFGEILSESRKYKLCLTVANQFLDQLPTKIRQTVFGNIANLLSFRVGADDAAIVAGECRPRLGDEDFLNLPLRDFYIKMGIQGEVQEAFSGRTLDLHYPPENEQVMKECIAHSRSKYCLPLQQALGQLGKVDFSSGKKVENS